jgi:hypothetical protein
MPEATDIHDSRELERGVNALMEASDAGAPDGANPPKAATQATASELDSAVGQMMAHAESPPSAPAAPAPAAPPIESLDEQLAEAADDLIAGEFADEERILNEAEGAAPPAGPAPVEAAAPAAPEPVAPKADVPKPAPKPAPTRKVPKPPSPKAVQPEPDPEPVVTAVRAAVLTKAASAISGPLASALTSVGATLSAPLKNRPQYVRDTVGWFALFTMFMAVCVWAYILLIRSPVAPDPEPVTHGDKAQAPAKAAGGEGEASRGSGTSHSAKTTAAKKAKPRKSAAKTEHAGAGEH